MRDITKCDPSKASRKAARQPSAVDPNIRRATRPTTRMDRVPTSATEKRHPIPEPEPNSHSPAAISHFPAGGCTTMSPSVVEKMSWSPPTNASSGFLSESSTRISTPKWSSE